jgi:hypothetical protein
MDDMPIVFKYTDEDAIEDGVLVRLWTLGITSRKINIATIGVIELFKVSEGKNGAQYDLSRLQKLVAHSENAMAAKKDWFYSIVWEGKKFFVAENETGYTILLPSEY